MQCPQEADLQCMFSIQLLYRKSGVQKGQVSFPEPQSCILLVFVQGMAGKGHEEEDEIKKMLLFLRYLLWTVFTTIPLLHPEGRCPGQDRSDVQCFSTGLPAQALYPKL